MSRDQPGLHSKAVQEEKKEKLYQWKKQSMKLTFLSFPAQESEESGESSFRVPNHPRLAWDSQALWQPLDRVASPEVPSLSPALRGTCPWYWDESVSSSLGSGLQVGTIGTESPTTRTPASAPWAASRGLCVCLCAPDAQLETSTPLSSKDCAPAASCGLCVAVTLAQAARCPPHFCWGAWRQSGRTQSPTGCQVPQ